MSMRLRTFGLNIMCTRYQVWTNITYQVPDTCNTGYKREHNKHANQEIRTTTNTKPILVKQKEFRDEAGCQRHRNTYLCTRYV